MATVSIRHLSTYTSTEYITLLLSMIKSCISVTRDGKRAFATYSCYNRAIDAVETLNNSELGGRTIAAKIRGYDGLIETFSSESSSSDEDDLDISEPDDAPNADNQEFFFVHIGGLRRHSDARELCEQYGYVDSVTSSYKLSNVNETLVTKERIFLVAYHSKANALKAVASLNNLILKGHRIDASISNE